MSKTEDLDNSTKWIFSDAAGGSAKAVDEFLADLVKEYPEERRLEFVRKHVALLSTQLNSITDQQKEQWEREREVAWIEARWATLKRSANMASRTFWITLALFVIALAGDAWAFFIAHGDTYMRLARDTVIGACIVATIGGPFVIRAAWKDIWAAEAALQKFVGWHNKTSDL
jgi:cation transport ATPase